MRSRAALLLTTATLVGLTPGLARADDEPDDPVAGAPGIGDPYYPLDGNGGYDVDHYDIDLRYDPATDEIRARTTVTARTTQELSSLNLDFQGLTVTKVTVDGKKADWTRDGGELTVTPKKPLEADEKVEIRVSYHGVPQPIQDALGISGFMHTDDGALVLGQPDVAATWFPSNDHPRDAAAVEVEATVPEGLEAVSNGSLQDQRTEAGWTTWEWSADEPMAPYLVTLAIGEFDVREYEADGIRYWDALDPDLFTTPATEEPGAPTLGANAEAALAKQPEITAFLAGLLGDYPYDESGGIVDDFAELAFALETQTRSVYAAGFFGDAVLADSVVVHELTHQWLGDSVRLDRWQDIWLNEGAATYAEWLWFEEQGDITAQEQFDGLLAVPQDDPFYEALWTVVPGDPGPAPGDLFSAAVYYRGAMTHHALRTEIGDEAYFRFLREWATSQAGQTVTTDEFIALAEEVSGQQLDALFETWLYTPGRPDVPPV